MTLSISRSSTSHINTVHNNDHNDVLCQNTFCESHAIREVNTFLEFTEVISYKKGDVVADMGELEASELIGTIPFFDNKPRSARIRALSLDTRLLCISKPLTR